MDRSLFVLTNQRNREAEVAGAFDTIEGAGKALQKNTASENMLSNRLIDVVCGIFEFVLLSREPSKLREELRETTDRIRSQDILSEISTFDAKVEFARNAHL